MTGKKCYELTELRTDGKSDIPIILPNGQKNFLSPFLKQDIRLIYDEEGIETVEKYGEPYYVIRFFPNMCGVYRVCLNDRVELINVTGGGNKGYIEVSKYDKRYLAYTDSSPYFPIGINLAFISPISKSDGTEFGLSRQYRYLGLRLYERWFKACAENGVNMARIWLGQEYLCPDTLNAGEFDLIQFAKIDILISLAEKYGIKLKLTIEQFRYFNYEKTADSYSYADDVFRKFNKRLYLGGKRCESIKEWLSGDNWKKKWLIKVNELAKRLSGNTAIFGIELWNEMNSLDSESVTEWNREMLPQVKALFPHQLVMNSLGSFDGDNAKRFYAEFCWEYSDIKQMHRYLDQGADYGVCHKSPIMLIKDGIDALYDSDKPLLVAETGAVNDCHSGPFRYYCCDHNGLLFCDLVYTPVFCLSCGVGNIWHWDDRYVESKNLYKYFKPIAELCSGIAFDREDFKKDLYEDEEIIFMLLTGKNVTLAFLRNKSDCWQNVLRDLKEPVTVKNKVVPCPTHTRLQTFNFAADETAACEIIGSELVIRNLKHGILLKFERKNF